MILTYLELQAAIDNEAVSGYSVTADELKTLSYQEGSVIFVPAATINRFLADFPKSETHVPHVHSMATSGALSTMNGVPVVTDLYAHPAIRLEAQQYTVYEPIGDAPVC